MQGRQLTMSVEDFHMKDVNELLAILDDRASTGLDLSPGDELCKEAAERIRYLFRRYLKHYKKLLRWLRSCFVKQPQQRKSIQIIDAAWHASPALFFRHPKNFMRFGTAFPVNSANRQIEAYPDQFWMNVVENVVTAAPVGKAGYRIAFQRGINRNWEYSDFRSVCGWPDSLDSFDPMI